MRLAGWKAGIVAFVILTFAAASAHAVILSSKPQRNTSPPAGGLANSGWQWQGRFGSFTGTPIAQQYFITAGHIGGEPGQTFSYNGQEFTTTAYFDDPRTDLRIWKVDGKFNTFAPIFRDQTEIGRSCVIFGRGTQRGDPVYQDGELKGWEWGPSDGAMSWGRNAIAGIVNGGPQRGELLTFSFDRSGIAQEGMLSAGDSGGGVFVRQGTRWKLVGINTSVDGPYAFAPGQNPFNAALFDKGGLFVPSRSGGTSVAESVTDIPAAAYVTRLSTNMEWINGVLSGQIAPGGVLPSASGTSGIPEPTGAFLTMAVLGAMTLMRMRLNRRP